MISALRLPAALWVVTSAALIGLASSVERGALVAGVYVVLNALGMAIALTKQPPYPLGALRVMAWCAAVQVPVMVVPLFDRDLTGVASRARRQRILQNEEPKPGPRDPER